MKKQPTDRLPRREFLKTTGAGLAGFGLLPAFSTTGQAQSSGSSARLVVPLNHNWLYSDKVLPNAASPTLDDRRFERVTIPHTNKLLPWHGFDDKSYQFISLYRRHFKLPPTMRGKRIFVDFDGVMTAAVRSEERRVGKA